MSMKHCVSQGKNTVMVISFIVYEMFGTVIMLHDLNWEVLTLNPDTDKQF